MVLSMDRWVGKVAVVTGASDGIGAEIVKELLNNGITVVGMARRKEKIEEISTSINLHNVKVDLTKENEIVDAFKWVNDNVGPIGILINSAGTFWVTSSIYIETKLWKNQFDTDLFGLILPTREVIKQMIANNIDGHIIHIGGISGHNVSVPNFCALSACKSAITSVTESLRQELVSVGSKIKISLVSVGCVETKILYKNVAEQKSLLDYEELFQNVTKLQSADVAAAVVYTLSTPLHVQVHNIQMRAVGSPF